MRDKRYISFIKEIILFLLIKMYVTLVTQKISANFPHSTVVTHEEKNVTLSFLALHCRSTFLYISHMRLNRMTIDLKSKDCIIANISNNHYK